MVLIISFYSDTDCLTVFFIMTGSPTGLPKDGLSVSPLVAPASFFAGALCYIHILLIYL